MSDENPTTKSLIPIGEEEKAYKQLCTYNLKSGWLPNKINTPEKAYIVALTGRELGISPITALRQINVIDGMPTLSGQLMLAMVKTRSPQSIINIKSKDTGCYIKVKRNPNEAEFSEFDFTMQDAKNAQLLGKDNWKKYPKDMCMWRAVSKMCRFEFPDLLGPVSYTPEEVENINVNNAREVSTAQKSETIKNVNQSAGGDVKNDIPAIVETQEQVIPSDISPDITEAQFNELDQYLEDGEPPFTAQDVDPNSELERLKDTMITYGKKYSGKTYGQVPDKELMDYIAFVYTKLSELNDSGIAKSKVFLEEAELYLYLSERQ